MDMIQVCGGGGGGEGRQIMMRAGHSGFGSPRQLAGSAGEGGKPRKLMDDGRRRNNIPVIVQLARVGMGIKAYGLRKLTPTVMFP